MTDRRKACVQAQSREFGDDRLMQVKAVQICLRALGERPGECEWVGMSMALWTCSDVSLLYYQFMGPLI